MNASDRHRKKRLRELIKRKYNENNAEFATAADITKGRVSQLLDEDEAFGERAGRTREQTCNGCPSRITAARPGET